MTAKQKDKVWEVTRGVIIAVIVLLATMQLNAAKEFMDVPKKNRAEIERMKTQRILDSLSQIAKDNTNNQKYKQFEKKQNETLKRLDRMEIVQDTILKALLRLEMSSPPTR